MPCSFFDLMLRVARQVVGEQAQHVTDVLRDMFQARPLSTACSRRIWTRFLAQQDVLNEELLMDHSTGTRSSRAQAGRCFGAAVDCAGRDSAWIIERCSNARSIGASSGLFARRWN